MATTEVPSTATGVLGGDGSVPLPTLTRVSELLPLFPLGTVLYPGVLLPLHVFEERYRVLVRTLIALPEGTRRRFGVVAIREGREVGVDGVRALYDVGCAAELRRVQAHEDGRFDIVTSGVERFRLRDIDDSLPYLQGDVEWLPEPEGADAAVLAAGVGRLFAAYRDALLAAQGAQEPEARELPTPPVVLSYLVAAVMVLFVPDKQRLLAAPDAAARLALELSLLRRETALVRRLPSLPAVELLQSGVNPH